jgi:hypothetical protein
MDPASHSKSGILPLAMAKHASLTVAGHTLDHQWWGHHSAASNAESRGDAAGCRISRIDSDLITQDTGEEIVLREGTR